MPRAGKANSKAWWIGYRIDTLDLLSLLRMLPDNLQRVMEYHSFDKHSEINPEDSEMMSEINAKSLTHEWRTFRRRLIRQRKTSSKGLPELLSRCLQDSLYIQF